MAGSRTTVEARRGAAGSDDTSFAIDHPGEVLAYLRRLRSATVAVSLSNARGASVSTTLWAIDAAHHRVAFDAKPGSVALADLVESDDATAVAYLDDVKLQFDLHDLVLVHGAGSSALQVRLPKRLYRFQRRGAYRVRTLARTSPTAEFRHPALPEMRLALRVLDVSSGGCALLLPDDVPAVGAGIRIAGVHLRLDSDTAFDTTLQVLHVTSIQPGAFGVRLGCALDALPVAAARTLQRYIDRTQQRSRPLGG